LIGLYIIVIIKQLFTHNTDGLSQLCEAHTNINKPVLSRASLVCV